MKSDTLPKNSPDSASEIERLVAEAKGGGPSKILTAVRFDPDVLAGLRATGRGWQTLINNTMREWLESHAA